MRPVTTPVAFTVPFLMLLGGLTACSSPSKAEPGAVAPTYALVPRTARPDEQAVRLPTVMDGYTACTVIGLTVGLPELVGSHADVKAKGRFVRVRIVLANNGRTSALIDVFKQRLVTGDGRAHPPDRDAMLIKRQAASLTLGAAMRVEFDLWFDVPAGARVSALRVYGGATLTDLKDLEGVDIRLG